MVGSPHLTHSRGALGYRSPVPPPGLQPNDLDLSCAIQSSDVLALVRSDAQLCGLNPSEFKGNAWRIGGASDLRDAPFTENGPPIDTVTATRLIKSRGRWNSDIHTIYERASLKEHARASAAMTEAGGMDLETILDGWIQPAQ